ncbi:MAG: hypothetical protein ACQEP8_01380 [Chlamydiota bacterium]
MSKIFRAIKDGFVLALRRWFILTGFLIFITLFLYALGGVGKYLVNTYEAKTLDLNKKYYEEVQELKQDDQLQGDNLQNLQERYQQKIQNKTRLYQVLTIAYSVGYCFVAGWIGLGFVNIILKMSQGRKMRFRHLFPNICLFLKYLGSALLFVLLVILCSLPAVFLVWVGTQYPTGQASIGDIKYNLWLTIAAAAYLLVIKIYLYLRYQFFPLYILDHKIGPIKALRSSAITMGGNKFKMLVFHFLMIAAAAWVVVLVTAPFSYLKITNQWALGFGSVVFLFAILLWYFTWVASFIYAYQALDQEDRPAVEV